MVVEKGYKQTEVGVIPVEWDTQKLVDLTKLFTKQTGFDYSAYIKPSLVQTQSDETIPFIQNKDFNNKWINFNTDYFIPLSVAKQFPKILLDEKSLLISISGSIGNIGVYESEHLAFIGGAVAILKFKDPRIIDWVLFFLKSSEGQKKLFGNVKAGSHQNLILEDIRKVTIPIPSFSEQTAIANALSDMDALITQTEKLIQKKKTIKQGVMQELLKPKEGWVTKKLGEVCEIYQPQTISADKFTNDGYLVYGANGVVGYYNHYNHKEWQVMITCRGSTCGTVNKSVNFSWITGNAMVMNVDFNKNIDKVFFYYLLLKQDFSQTITGSGQPQIVRAPLANFWIKMPKQIEEQKIIGETLKDIDTSIEKLETKLQKLKLQKQGMMQALLTGKIRLI
jgi:type I restriction enzyme S subunit